MECQCCLCRTTPGCRGTRPRRAASSPTGPPPPPAPRRTAAAGNKISVADPVHFDPDPDFGFGRGRKTDPDPQKSFFFITLFLRANIKLIKMNFCTLQCQWQ